MDALVIISKGVWTLDSENIFQEESSSSYGKMVVCFCIRCFRYAHIISNLVFQLLLGIPLEMVHKFWRVGIVYCLGVIIGQFVHQLSALGFF